jgi:perosamine synthetase
MSFPTHQDLNEVFELLKSHDISGWFHSHDGGPILREFQKQFADFLGVKYAFACSSGNAAIYIALKAVGIGFGKVVAVPAYTHIGSVAPIILAGGMPYFVDVDFYGNFKVEDLENKSFDAVIPVHQLGNICEMDSIKNNIFGAVIIEDASHALGSKYYGKYAGTLGDIGCFSIGGGRTKIIGTGEGGMIVTNDDKYAEKIKNIRNHGDRITDVDYLCFNFRMSDLNAAVGYVEMKKIEKYIKWQKLHALVLTNKLPKYLAPIPVPAACESNRYLIGCIFQEKEAGMTRDEWLKRIRDLGFEGGVPRKNVGPGYSKLVCDIKFYRKYKNRELPNSVFMRDNSVWIDWHRYPRTVPEIDQLIEAFNKAIS